MKKLEAKTIYNNQRVIYINIVIEKPITSLFYLVLGTKIKLYMRVSKMFLFIFFFSYNVYYVYNLNLVVLLCPSLKFNNE